MADTAPSNNVETDSNVSVPQVSEEDMVSSQTKEKPFPVKIIVSVLLLGLLVYVIVDSFTAGNVRNLLTGFLDFIEDSGFWGAVLFAVVYIIATVLLIPGTILTLGAGFVFTRTTGSQALGTIVATAVVFFGASIGATLAFICARFLLRDYAAKLTEKYKVFRAIDKAIATNGLKTVFLLRLSPAVPFNVLNYLLGTTAVTLKEYILACFGLLPGTAAFCFIGSTLSSLAEVKDGKAKDGNGNTVQLVLSIIGGIASIIVVLILSVYARRELNKYLKKEEEETTDQAHLERQDTSNLLV